MVLKVSSLLLISRLVASNECFALDSEVLLRLIVLPQRPPRSIESVVFCRHESTVLESQPIMASGELPMTGSKVTVLLISMVPWLIISSPWGTPP